MYISIHVKYRLFLSDFNEIGIFWADFTNKYSDIKFRGNPSSGCRVLPCGRKDRQR
jgi:hypothetical protein